MTTAPTPSRSWRRRVLGVLAAVVLVAAGAIGGWWWSNRAAASPTSASTTSTQLATASLGTVKETVSASGTVEPANSSTATFTSSGTVTAVDVEVGDTVTKGQVLATIDDSDLEDAVTLAHASVAAAQDQVDSASTTESLASAKAQRASARSQLADAEAALAGATLRAPMSGTVASVGLAVGDSTGSGSSGAGAGGATGGSGGTGTGTGSSTGTATTTSTTGIQVVDTRTWVVDASVSSSDLGSLQKGLQATITPSGATQNVFGTVKSVGVVASSSSSGTATFPVVIAVTGSPEGLNAGTTATVAITVKQLTDVLTVPTQAVRTTNGETTVQLSTDGKVTTTPVTVGGIYGTSTVITKGLSEGDQVVVTTRSFPRTQSSTSTGSNQRQDQGGFPGGDFGGGAPPAGGPPPGVGQ